MTRRRSRSGVATLAVAWLFSQVSPAWTTRYLGVALGPDLPAGLARPRTRRQPGARRAGDRSSASGRSPRPPASRTSPTPPTWPRAVADDMRPGDLVVTLQPEQHPLIHYHLRNGMIEATQLGEVETQGRHGLARRAGQARGRHSRARTWHPCLIGSRESGRVLLVHPVTSSIDDWDAPWTQLVRRDRPSGARRWRPTSGSRASARCPPSTAAPGASGCAACSTRRPPTTEMR